MLALPLGFGASATGVTQCPILTTANLSQNGVTGINVSGNDPTHASGSNNNLQTIQVTEGNYFFKLDHHYAPPGKIHFVDTNKGPAEHEFVIIQTDLKANNLPTKNGMVDISDPHLQKVFDHAQFAAGKTIKMTVNLKAGHYALICNLPGHDQQGMHTDLTITKNAASMIQQGMYLGSI